MHRRAHCSCGSLVASRSTPRGYAVRSRRLLPICCPLDVSMLEAEIRPRRCRRLKGTFTISRRTHPSRLDVFGKTEAAGQRGVGEEGDLVDLAAAQAEHHHAPGLRA